MGYWSLLHDEVDGFVALLVLAEDIVLAGHDGVEHDADDGADGEAGEADRPELERTGAGVADADGEDEDQGRDEDVAGLREVDLVLDDVAHADRLSGEVTIAVPQLNPNLLFPGPESIVIVGEQPDVARRAIEQNVNCLIVCQAGLPEELREMPTKTCIIATPFDAFRAARMVYHAIEISRICRTDDLEAFHLSDFVDDVKEVVLKSRHRSYPILDENDKVVGTLSRFHLIKPRRKRVVLVDRNEAAQSVPGLEQADILAIIDHHRLADIQTGGPIYFRNEPVGSTATIIASMYQERGLMPSQKLAGLMAAAIVADTVMFKSPTATPRDHRMAERMARIANISLDELGREIFSASIGTKCPSTSRIWRRFRR